MKAEMPYNLNNKLYYDVECIEVNILFLITDNNI